MVRELLGVQLLIEVADAKIVTSSSFSTEAQKASNVASHNLDRISVDLVDAEILMRELEAYNTDLPPLNAVVERYAYMRKNLFSWPSSVTI